MTQYIFHNSFNEDVITIDQQQLIQQLEFTIFEFTKAIKHNQDLIDVYISNVPNATYNGSGLLTSGITGAICVSRRVRSISLKQGTIKYEVNLVQKQTAGIKHELDLVVKALRVVRRGKTIKDRVLVCTQQSNPPSGDKYKIECRLLWSDNLVCKMCGAKRNSSGAAKRHSNSMNCIHRSDIVVKRDLGMQRISGSMYALLNKAGIDFSLVPVKHYIYVEPWVIDAIKQFRSNPIAGLSLEEFLKKINTK